MQQSCAHLYAPGTWNKKLVSMLPENDVTECCYTPGSDWIRKNSNYISLNNEVQGKGQVFETPHRVFPVLF